MEEKEIDPIEFAGMMRREDVATEDDLQEIRNQLNEMYFQISPWNWFARHEIAVRMDTIQTVLSWIHAKQKLKQLNLKDPI